VLLLIAAVLVVPATSSCEPPGAIPIPAMPAILTQSPPPVLAPAMPGLPPAMVIPAMPAGLVIEPCSTCGHKKVCAPGTEMKKTTSYSYSTKTVEFCVPSSGLHALLHPADAEACSTTPRTKRVLVKKAVTEEVPACRCQPVLHRESAPVPTIGLATVPSLPPG